ncbi:hypothetical protein BK720_01700 [Bacillus thuringiensis serovar brasilensis]|uniref:hypothetical protein n=1 Tax=Bacillus cereus group TaxID=86661 RepID=UPI000A365F6F|nr:hypothetical protein [Bacillus thuringiensis]MCU5031528.1 hypothetical protein [Bacillus cereus]MRA75127.1 hypothetical protein [Bacillus thuringiensis]MRA92343.1 hypothetical protein [Bacillus thuringiensis]MRC54632.1 hypothetical protein [Bacillus thuringiensis]OTX39047.1 hypothetical protein BK720_01700 [Bacillus thuringiensis serovar brasilensis]
MTILLGMSVLQWVPLASAIISFCAVVVAISALGFQYWQFKRNREPVIGPAIKSFDLELPETHLDWETGEQLDDKFSGTTIPVYNYSGTTAINISYNYKIINLLEIEKVLNNFPKSSSHSIKIDSVNEKPLSFDLVFKNNTSTRRIMNIKSYIRRQDLIKPGEKVDILLPSYSLIIINYMFLFSAFEDIVLPKLELTIRYNDVNHKTWMVKYKVEMDRAYKFSGSRLESCFISEFVSKEKLK